MRRLLTLVTVLAMCVAQAGVIDRIAVSVGKSVITEADLTSEIRITAFLNSDRPDFSAENKRRTAERMVDQRLVRVELEAIRYALPSAADAEGELKEVRSRFANEAAYRRALAEYQVSEEDLNARLLWQLGLVRFIDERFRPGIQLSDEDIRNYFNSQLRPLIEKEHPGQAISLDDYREQVEQTMTSQAANKQADQWLQLARRRTRVVYHEEVFQ